MDRHSLPVANHLKHNFFRIGFLEGTSILPKYSELNDAGSDSSRVCGDNDVPLAFLRRGHSDDLPVSFPLRYQQTVAAIDEDSNLSV